MATSGALPGYDKIDRLKAALSRDVAPTRNVCTNVCTGAWPQELYSTN